VVATFVPLFRLHNSLPVAVDWRLQGRLDGEI